MSETPTDSDTEQDSVENPPDQSAFAVEFPPATPAETSGRKLPLQRFHDVNVRISVELGRVSMPIGELLMLTEGAVVELDRNVSDTLDIMAQGVRIAAGEVVVVDDRYAVRITELEDAPDTFPRAAN